MKTYLLIANDEITHERTPLGTVVANSPREAALFLAYNFPQHYFLANIITLDDSGKEIGWLALSCREEYEHAYAQSGMPVPSPVEIATLYLMNEMKRINNMCDMHIDRGDVCYTVWDSVKSVDGRIVKDDRSTEEA